MNINKLPRAFFNISKGIANTILDTVYPKYCVMCGRMMPANVSYCVCTSCQPAQQKRKRYITDKKCGCDEVMAPFRYDGITRRSMLRFKFKGVKYIGYTFASSMSDMLKHREFVDDDCLLLPVPIHISRDRAYNQSEVLADYISEQTGIPVSRDAVYKIRPISRISGMKHRDKRFFIKDSFHIDASCNFTGKTLIIIDDIYTSGTTLKELSDLLRMHGATRVYAVTACVAE